MKQKTSNKVLYYNQNLIL